MWAYIYYSMYLDRVDINDHNATEKYVFEKVCHFYPVSYKLLSNILPPTAPPPPAPNPQIKDGNISYIPFNKALVLTEVEDEGEQLKKELEELSDTVKKQFQLLSSRLSVMEVRAPGNNTHILIELAS